MHRRDLLKTGIGLPLLTTALSSSPLSAGENDASLQRRKRPGDPTWPSARDWEALDRHTGGRLSRPVSPFASCSDSSAGSTCKEALSSLRNPYFLGDQPALTQASGWADAWTCASSAYAVAAEKTSDVVAAINFARVHNLRLVVRGGGHGYQGTSSAPDSLLIWTRRMDDVVLHEGFVAQGCEAKQTPQAAVSVGAGALWADAYEAVTTRGGRYIQGGGCRTVGVAGLLQGGGFGSWSKAYGTAAAGLIEAEVVTADGAVRTVNECLDPDLFWAIRGGGGGTFGVVTRFTIRTEKLPEYFGAVSSAVRAGSDEAYRALIAKALQFYRSALFNEHWGEKFSFRTDNTLDISMLFQGLSRQQVEAIWAPFFDWVRARQEYSLREPLVLAVPAQRFWDPQYMNAQVPGVAIVDDRPGAPAHHVFWKDNQYEAGQFLYAYKSTWLPAGLLEPKGLPALVEAIFHSSRKRGLEFHFGKGLAGGSAQAIRRVRDTATNPQVLNAFALVIIGSSGPPGYPGMPGVGVDLVRARDAATHSQSALEELLKVAPHAGTYVSESDFFQAEWQTAFWGTHYSRLLAVKNKYDPLGLFFVHHGVGSEAWSADGFTRVQRR